MKKITLYIFTALFLLLQIKSNAQLQNSNSSKQTALIGVWAMFNERHPDGWKTWKKPYEYLEFREDGKYIRTIVFRKINYAILGNYEISNDSLIIFHGGVATDGEHTEGVPEFISRLYSIKSDGLELWEDWKRTIWKGTKKMGHKKKFRPLTMEENKKLELAHKIIFPFDDSLKQ